ncbi:MAG: hypothetical protein DRN05_05615, partial [Thermoplasmata archaeon]
MKTYLTILICMLLSTTTVFSVAGEINKDKVEDETAYSNLSDVDWWPMFHHDLNHTGYSTSTTPPENDNLYWETTIGEMIGYSSPAVVDNKIYICNHGKIFCIDATDGSILWNYTTDGYIHASPAVTDNKV